MPYPSIFNDVIGPVMRGPSSSHCAAALRIGRIAHDLLGGPPDKVSMVFDTNGSLATTHASQGSDMGLSGGLLGWEATDERLPEAEDALALAGVRLEIALRPFEGEHPNTYWLDLHRGATRLQLKAISTGGGMISVLEVDGLPVTMSGGLFETLLDVADSALALNALAAQGDVQAGRAFALGKWARVQIESRAPLEMDWAALGALRVRQARPVLPVLDSDREAPYETAAGLLAHDNGRGLPLWELACEYEALRGGMTPNEVLAHMSALLGIMRAAVERGLAGTHWADRILGPQAGTYVALQDAGRLLDAGLLNRIIPYVTALMEAKSALEVVVAAPTAGACGALPGAVLGAGDTLGSSEADLARAMLAGGLIGVLIAARSTFAAEVCGCQAECGAASGMAAAALAQLAGGSLQQCLTAASLALQNVMGMICDPVANRVEAPCLGKNVLAASNALACANMALAGYDAVIPLDEVIAASDAVGRSLPHELRCTALGGLSVTPTSQAIARRLARQ